MNQLVAVVIDGLIYSSWLFIIAVGLTLIYGVMKILNIAHGSLYALGAYSAAALAGYWINQGHAPMGSYAVMLGAAILVGLAQGRYRTGLCVSCTARMKSSWLLVT